ncbi:MAG: YncE family protein [Spirochaetota bacterium]
MVKFKHYGLWLLVFAGSCADFERPAKPNAPASGVILMVGTDFSTGFLSAIEPLSLSVSRDIFSLYNDSVLRYNAADQSTYVIQRLGSDSVRRLNNVAQYETVYERSVGTQANPQDIAFLPGNRMAVTLYNRSKVSILDRPTGNLVGEADLSAYVDGDGYAEISPAVYANGHLYVAIQRLNRAATNAIWPPLGQSYLAKIDANSYQVVLSTLLTHSNPVSRLHHHAGRNSLLFAAPGLFYANASLDGACLEYSLATDTLLTPPITEAQAGYEISDCHIRADGSGVFVGNDTSLNSVFGLFNATAHSVTRVAASLSSANGGYFSDFLLHSNGKVYLADRNIFAPGVRVFSGTNLTEETSQAVYTGLPPFMFEEVP